MTSDAAVLWKPTTESLAAAALNDYLAWLARARGRTFASYRELWEWSCTDLDGFWSSLWTYFGFGDDPGVALAEAAMPGARWFPEAGVNFAQACLRAPDEHIAIIAVTEPGASGSDERVELSYADLRAAVAERAATLRAMGVGPGDTVAAYLPNIPEAVIGLLATAAVGATWTSTSPDFGTQAVLSRLQQVAPKVLIAADGYHYNGKVHRRSHEVAQIVAELPSLTHVITVSYIGESGWLDPSGVQESEWESLVPAGRDTPAYADVGFEHPLWILWSSGTTGQPKGIVHGHGGIVLELLKGLVLHSDLRQDDRYFFVTSTSWMVWNYLVGALMVGSTIVLYDGAATYPDVNGIWAVAERTGSTVVGVGAGYLIAGHQAAATPRAHHDLSALRVIQQTGSTLPPDAWVWTDREVMPGGWFQSISGGTDICSVLVGPNPMLPVVSGRLTAPYLGCSLAAWDEAGLPVVGEQGELVVTRPMPSMPLHFVGDPDGARYRDAYFDVYPGIWRHGDWIIMREDLSVEILGRSDSTLNRQGVRMGSADIYAVLDGMTEFDDSLVVGVEQPGGGYYMPLFVSIRDGELTDELVGRVRAAIRNALSPRHVPDEIIQVPAVPRTLTGKRVEVPVKKILQGKDPRESAGTGAIRPEGALDWYVDFAARRAAR